MSEHPFNVKKPNRYWRYGRVKRNPLPPNVTEKFEEVEVPVRQTECPVGIEPSTLSESRSLPMANVEAVLFVAREPMSSRRLAQMAELPAGIRIRTILQQLNEDYDRRQCAFRIVEVAGGFQLRTRPEFAPWLVRLQEVPVTVRLSGPAMETLSVIAYRQPVGRADVERIRGVQCGELIRQLMERDLVKIVGRSEELGRPFFYGTTRTFLEVFGLGNLRDLPDYELFALPDADDVKPDSSTEK